MPCSGCLTLHGVNPNLKKTFTLKYDISVSVIYKTYWGWSGHAFLYLLINFISSYNKSNNWHDPESLIICNTCCSKVRGNTIHQSMHYLLFDPENYQHQSHKVGHQMIPLIFAFGKSKYFDVYIV